jgi:hypothetical protein
MFQCLAFPHLKKKKHQSEYLNANCSSGKHMKKPTKTEWTIICASADSNTLPYKMVVSL